MFKSIYTRAETFCRENPTTVRFAGDGLLIAAATNIVSNNNNLFATRLGASDYQLSLLQFLPQIVNLCVLLPGGIATDTLRNKQKMVIGMMLASGLLYALIGLTPLMPVSTLGAFLALLSASAGTLTLYNLSWQSFFPEVVPVANRNHILSWRTLTSVFAGMLAPMVTGAILAHIPNMGGKVAAHQAFFLTASLFMFWAAFNFRRFSAIQPSKPQGLSFSALKKAGRSLLGNKNFLFFAGVAMFFHLSWQLDWTVHYIGQTQYLHMNEWILGLAVMTTTGVQFLTLRFWSRVNERLGVILPVVFGGLGLASYAFTMYVATGLPPAIALYVWFFMIAIGSLPFVTVTLNLYQCLLQALDETYRSLCISIYTCLTCFTNAIMPVAGVALYKTLGGDLHGLRQTFLIIGTLRLAATALWFLRWKLIKTQDQDQSPAQDPA